jgi:hypothetical protein
MRRVIFGIFLFIVACVDPLSVKVTESDRRIVVDGLITNLPGPYQVKLFYSNSLRTDRLAPFEPVRQAFVSIIDDLGNEYDLTEISPGLYETNANELTGEIGRSYHVSINTQSEGEYQSEPQELTDPGEVTNLYFKFKDEPLAESSFGLDVFIDSKGVLSEDNLFRWRWTTIHKTVSSPELETITTPGGERPAPEPCSGYVFRQGQLIKVGECTCCICWSYNYNEGSYVSKNDFVTDNTFNNQFLGSIPVTAMHFYDRYYIDVQQLSLSEEAYNFWDLIEKQQKGATDLFQPDAIKIKGNIKSISNPNEQALGFFGVSGVASKSTYIEQSEIPYELPEIETIRYSCLNYFKNATTEKPSFW